MIYRVLIATVLSILVLVLANCAANSQAGPTSTPAVRVEVTHEPPVLVSQVGPISYYQMKLGDTVLEYAVVLPDDFQAGQTYPVLLALPPDGQTKEMTEWALNNFWVTQAQRRGWVVLSPLAPDGQLFFQGAEKLIPDFLARTAEQYPPEGGKYYLAGVSNGGLSAFRVAIAYPELAYSILVLPGLPYSDEDFAQLERIKDIPVAMFVGAEDDEAWIKRMQATQAALSELGDSVSLEIMPGEKHDIESLIGGERLFDLLESFRAAN